MDGERKSDLQSRRRFVRLFGAVAGGLAASGRAAAAKEPVATHAPSNVPPSVPQWMKEQGAPVGASAYGAPSPFEKNVVRLARTAGLDTSGVSFTPLQHLTGIITPNGLHFERHHAGVPAVDPAQHRLMIHGLVKRPLLLTMDDIVRFPSVSRIHFIECSGNTIGWNGGDPKWTVQESHGLLSCCEWTGVPLATILDEVGLEKSASWILAEGADAAGLARSIPLEKALDDAVLVYAQNGERLRPEQGYPLRLLLPGFEGNTNIKWLRRLKVGDQPFETREETSKYTDLMADGTARQFTFVMEAKSVITFPSAGHLLKQKGFYEISGLAWSGHGRIRRVDVSVDGGKTWREANLQTPILPKCLTRFRLPWSWQGEPALLQSRAVDETGYVQPTRSALVDVRGMNSGYHFNGIQTWNVKQDGTVSNAI